MAAESLGVTSSLHGVGTLRGAGKHDQRRTHIFGSIFIWRSNESAFSAASHGSCTGARPHSLRRLRQGTQALSETEGASNLDSRGPGLLPDNFIQKQAKKLWLPPISVTLDRRRIDERQLARLMSMADYSPCAFTAHRGRPFAALEAESITRTSSEPSLLSNSHEQARELQASPPETGQRKELHLPSHLPHPTSLAPLAAPALSDRDQGTFLESVPHHEVAERVEISQVTGGASTSPRGGAEGTKGHLCAGDLGQSRDFGQSKESLKKLRRALDHSTVVVGLLVKAKALERDYMVAEGDSQIIRDSKAPQDEVLLDGQLPYRASVSRADASSDMRLVAFARASSDVSLTASIHDVVVHPDFQGLGLGRRVVQRMVRDLNAMGIGDIALLCPEQMCDYFRRLGFASDRLRTATMLYTAEPTRVPTPLTAVHHVWAPTACENEQEGREREKADEADTLPWGSRQGEAEVGGVPTPGAAVSHNSNAKRLEDEAEILSWGSRSLAIPTKADPHFKTKTPPQDLFLHAEEQAKALALENSHDNKRGRSRGQRLTVPFV